MKLFVLSLVYLLSLVCFAHSSNKHMICKDVDDVFGDVTNDDIRTRYMGPPGEKGIQGEKGSPGNNGQPGRIDNDKVQEIIRLKVEEETRLLQVKVDKMEAQIQNLTSQIPVVRCVGGVTHEGICYWAEVHPSEDTNYAEAERICSNKGSTLADINGKVHFDLIMSYLRQKLHGSSGTHVWTGMRKIYENNIAQLSNGSPAPYTRQRNSHWWDYTRSSYTHVYLFVRSSTVDPDQGMGSYSPSRNFQGALCQTE